MPNPNNLRQNRPLLFSPSVVRSIVEEDIGSGGFHRVDYETISSTSLDSTSSFRYNLPGEGLRSTQQLNIDWADFENHTFFNSAHVKTNVAFRKIFDQFPFDGSQAEFEIFLDGLTGFEKWVYDEFPKNKGYLFLSGTNPSEAGTNGTYVKIEDVAGVAYPGVSRNTSGVSILNPGLNSMTLEFWTYMPTVAASSSVLLQKVVSGSGNNGFEVFCPTSNTSTGICQLGIFSGSYAITTSISFSKGSWNHLAYVWDRSIGVDRVFSYLNGTLVASSSQQEFGIIAMDGANLLVGSGSTVSSLTPLTTFSGAIDELRIWHSIRTQAERDESQKKNVFAQTNLKAYYKFNEASGSQTPIVLDHSGNSLHGTLSTWAVSHNIREVASGSVAGDAPMTYEQLANNPVLFPLHPSVEDLNDTLLDNADEFDRINPNRIDRLIPKHYLLQGQDQDGLSTEEGPIIDALTAAGTTPDTAKLGDTQVILMLLYTWAKFFDEMKLYIQAFGNLLHLDYDSTDTIPDTFLQLMAEKFGVRLPPLFTGTSIEQFINGENIDNTISTGTYSLQYIQNQIWRRILLNLKDILRSKGTIHSVKSFIRAVGIDPDNNFRIREFGGPTIKALANVRETRSEVSTLVSLTGSARIQSPFLSGSHTEPGWPYPANLVGSASNDGLFTSGSWTFEGIYRFPSTASFTSATQSLARIGTTGSHANAQPMFVLANLVAINNGGLKLYVNSGPTVDLIMSSSADIFDGNPWYVSFGRSRGDQIGTFPSSSYFLRAARQEFGDIVSVYSQSAYYADGVGSKDLWNRKYSDLNASGAFIEVGSNPLLSSTDTAISSSDTAKTATNFEGRAGHFRFWSKALSDTEWREHVRNFKSLGVEDPTKNFNFVSSMTGSFEKVRMDVSTDQIELSSSVSGFLQLTDFTQNGLHWSGSFAPSTTVIVPQRFQYSLLSPKFDVGATTDKVRVRSFESYENVLSSTYAQVAPLYSMEPSERPQDSTRFTIDFSVVDALDQDIINIFSTLDLFDNVIGNPELVFSPDYPQLEVLRDVYFNRLTERVNLKSFFEFYKWFDTNIGSFISQLIPRKTKFLGTNFVIESHMLERPKMEYLYSDIYLGDSTRHALKDTILFQQFVGYLSRF